MLRRHLQAGSIGRLSIEGLGPSIAVYMMQGEILAALASDDTPAIMHRLLIGGSITHRIAERLESESAQGVAISDMLFGIVPEEIVAEALANRFRENLASFLSYTQVPVYEEMDAVLVDNIQLGHDSKVLFEQILTMLDRVRPLLEFSGKVRVIPGPTAPDSLESARFLDLSEQTQTVDELLAQSPFERIQSANFLMDLVESQILSVELIPQSVEEPAPPTRIEQPEPLIEDLQPLDSSSVEPVLDPPQDPEPARSEPSPARPRIVYDLDGDSAPESDEPSDRPTEDTLFRDFDRLPRQSGQFTASREFLDYVDLSSALEPEDGNQSLASMLEMEDAEDPNDPALGKVINLCFGAPRLTNDEIRAKIDVVNAVLREISLTLDMEQEPGTGKAAIQMLLEGAPPIFGALFFGLEARRDGTINPESLLKNLQRRPESEHRVLLNEGLKNLIERGLGVVVDTTSTQAVDLMLGRIAGYQHRIGI